MRFFLSDILFPCLSFLVLAYLAAKRKRPGTPMPGWKSAGFSLVGCIALAVAAWVLISGLSSGDDWGGLPVLIVALACGGGALFCLACFAWALMAQAVADDSPSHVEQARERARQAHLARLRKTKVDDSSC